MALTLERRHDLLTLVAIGVAAHVTADVVHEVLGHGLACLFTGGRITLLTSVFFRNEPLSRLVAAAGPCANVIAGAAFLLAFRRLPIGSASARLFLLFAMAFNFFWAAGYFIYSGVANEGDWAVVIRDLSHPALYRMILIALGIISYFVVARVIARAVATVSRWDLARLVLVPYLAAGLAACVAAAFYESDWSGTLAGAFREGFLANIPLLGVPRRSARIGPSSMTASAPIARSYGWLIGTGIAYVLFVLVLGRGIAME